MVIERYIFVISIKNRIDDSIDQIIIDPINASFIDLYDRFTNVSKKIIFIPISDGTIAADFDAKSVPLFNAMKMNAIIIVDGIVPRIPPIFVPYFSAITVMIITIIADSMNGNINCIRRFVIS